MTDQDYFHWGAISHAIQLAAQPDWYKRNPFTYRAVMLDAEGIDIQEPGVWEEYCLRTRRLFTK